MSESKTEKYICEMLMTSKNLSSKLWNVLITNKGIHFIFFRKLPVFEMIVLLLVWLAIFCGAILTKFNKLAIFSSILLVISLIYILDRQKIQNRWETFIKKNLKEKIFSNTRNIHFKKDDIRKIFLENGNIIIATNSKIYKFRYYNDGIGYYKNGKDPFQNVDVKFRIEKCEMDFNKVFGSNLEN